MSRKEDVTAALNLKVFGLHLAAAECRNVIEGSWMYRVQLPLKMLPTAVSGPPCASSLSCSPLNVPQDNYVLRASKSLLSLPRQVQWERVEVEITCI